MRQFTHKNDGFNCIHCQAEIPPATSTCRNHCTNCLWSLHVDVNPGDRASHCQAPMRPRQVVTKGAEIVALMHVCTACGHVQKNRLAGDDSREALFAIVEQAAMTNATQSNNKA